MTKHAPLLKRGTVREQPDMPPAKVRGPLYYAFLSYSHKDQGIADWLHRELERFRTPRALAGRLTENGVIPKRLTPIFRDRHELAAADDLGEEIREALAASRFLIVLCSPHASKSRWTNAEIEEFKRNRPEGCVLAAIIAGEPFASDIAGRENEECFPPALTQKYDRRGRPTGKRAEPLAADLRDTGDGRRMGFLKLVAGMLGVGLDDLLQRETTRRHRRLAWVAAASLGGMAFTSTLAVTAIQSREAARDQRREAEGLVAFMLGDLRKKLEPIGKLDALDGVGSRVLAYYSKQDASELSDAGLMQRAQALNLTAQVAYQRGRMDTAQQLYRQAMAGTAEAVRRNPGDAERLFDHAQNVFWIGEIARSRGQTGDAEAAYREYKRLANRMAALEPDNLKWRMEGAYADHNIGIVYRNQRRFPEAARQFADAVRVFENVASIQASNADYQSSVANGLGWRADAERDLGNLPAAIEIRRRQIAYLRGVLGRGADNVAFRERLLPAHQGLGILLTVTRGPEEGIEQFRQAITEGRRLISVEPDNTTWRGLTAQVQLELARTLLSAGRRAEAEAENRTGCAWAAQVLARDRGPKWRHLRTDCLTNRARLLLEGGASAEALSLAEQALASARGERAADPVANRYRIAAAFRLRGDVRKRMGDGTGATAAWNAGLAQLPQNVAERPAELNERAELLKRLGMHEEARAIAQRLARTGYNSAG